MDGAVVLLVTAVVPKRPWVNVWPTVMVLPGATVINPLFVTATVDQN